LSAIGPSSQRRLTSRGDGAGEKLQSVALTSLTTFLRVYFARILAPRPGRGNRAGGEFSSAAGPASYACSARVAQARDRLAVQRDRGAIGGGRVIASRAEMAPQGLENIESAPEHGATARIVNREPAACRLRSKVEREAERESPGNGAASL